MQCVHFLGGKKAPPPIIFAPVKEATFLPSLTTILADDFWHALFKASQLVALQRMEGVMAREAPKEPGRSYAGDEGDESFCDARDASTPYMPSSTEPSPRPDDAVDQADDIPLARRVILQEETPQDVCSICIDEFTDDDPGMETTCK